jgi:hypothetical protein
MIFFVLLFLYLIIYKILEMVENLKKESLKNQYPSNIYDVVLLVANKTNFDYSTEREPFYNMLDKIIDKKLLSTEEKNKIINEYPEFCNILNKN